jgi:hypothetical protein
MLIPAYALQTGQIRIAKINIRYNYSKYRIALTVFY